MRTGRAVLHRWFFMDIGWNWGRARNLSLRIWRAPCGAASRKPKPPDCASNLTTRMESVQTYYALHCRTRRRHGLPPQPFRFFSNMQRRMLQAGPGFHRHRPLGGQAGGGGGFFASRPAGAL